MANATAAITPLVTQVSSEVSPTAAAAAGSVPTGTAGDHCDAEEDGAAAEGRGAAEKVMHGATP